MTITHSVKFTADERSALKTLVSGHADWTNYRAANLNGRHTGEMTIAELIDCANTFEISLHSIITATAGTATATHSLAPPVGPAEVFQLAPGTVQWGTTPPTAGTTLTGIPEAWVPVLLHDLFDDDTGFVFDSYQRRFLMQRPFTLPDSVGPDRWPLESREAFYVSGNNQGVFSPNVFNPKEVPEDSFGAESLFVWAGNDRAEQR